MSFFTGIVRIHYKGRFEVNASAERVAYVDGIVDELQLDPDRLSFFEFMGLLHDAGYKNIHKLFFLSPGKSIINGLVVIEDDKHALKLGNYLRKLGEIDVYVEHAIDIPVSPIREIEFLDPPDVNGNGVGVGQAVANEEGIAEAVVNQEGIDEALGNGNGLDGLFDAEVVMDDAGLVENVAANDEAVNVEVPMGGSDEDKKVPMGSNGEVPMEDDGVHMEDECGFFVDVEDVSDSDDEAADPEL
ncbi:hypothetical protein COLO4_19236 [Corchorus olitorius]|uniref:PB1-like domain-containing protein n=1 Tax=Corchorus olitorius TaxID=93759 RepID=A0A1R3J645_9ROSI|nr:hypothetical protein COLO4_19236 [Corchorus olitorius]